MSYNQSIFEITRSQDVELAEDLNRRMTGPMTTVSDVDSFFGSILHQYPTEWVKPTTQITDKTTFEQWCKFYRGQVLPFLMANRLPPVAAGCRPIYPL